MNMINVLPVFTLLNILNRLLLISKNVSNAGKKQCLNKIYTQLEFTKFTKVG